MQSCFFTYIQVVIDFASYSLFMVAIKGDFLFDISNFIFIRYDSIQMNT